MLRAGKTTRTASHVDVGEIRRKLGFERCYVSNVDRRNQLLYAQHCTAVVGARLRRSVRDSKKRCGRPGDEVTRDVVADVDGHWEAFLAS